MSFNIFSNTYKKTERLCSAIFLVSDTIENSEELRTKIKSLTIDLLSQCALLKDSMPSEKTRLTSKVEAILMEISSLLHISLVSGFISEMNASILKQELAFLNKDIIELCNYYNERSKIPTDFFKISNENPVIDDRTSNASLYLNSAAENKRSETLGNQDFIKDNKVKEKDKSNRKEDREKTIINLIKTKGNVSIKDISKSIKGCSEKTIQRKLIYLIDTGVIKKEGERRWSRYSLV